MSGCTQDWKLPQETCVFGLKPEWCFQHTCVQSHHRIMQKSCSMEVALELWSLHAWNSINTFVYQSCSPTWFLGSLMMWLSKRTPRGTFDFLDSMRQPSFIVSFMGPLQVSHKTVVFDQKWKMSEAKHTYFDEKLRMSAQKHLLLLQVWGCLEQIIYFSSKVQNVLHKTHISDEKSMMYLPKHILLLKIWWYLMQNTYFCSKVEDVSSKTANCQQKCATYCTKHILLSKIARCLMQNTYFCSKVGDVSSKTPIFHQKLRMSRAKQQISIKNSVTLEQLYRM